MGISTAYDQLARLCGRSENPAGITVLTAEEPRRKALSMRSGRR